MLLNYLYCWSCLEFPHAWKKGWNQAVGGAGGCDQGSNRKASAPGSWLPTLSRSPSPSPLVSDSASCDCRGPGICRGGQKDVSGKAKGVDKDAKKGERGEKNPFIML